MSSNKRPASSIGNLISRSNDLAKRTATENPSGGSNSGGSGPTSNNPFLSRPTPPEVAIKTFLLQARSTARNRPPSQRNQPVEIEARLGTLVSPYGIHSMRALSSGAKQLNIKGTNRIFHAFVCNISPGDNSAHKTKFEGGITRSNYLKWTNGGVSETSPLTNAFSVQTKQHESESASIKSQLAEHEYVETVFCYMDATRINFPHNPPQSNILGRGHKERKEKISVVDIALPAAPYDLRLQLASEVPMEGGHLNPREVPKGWNQKRIKRRRSYSRVDKSFAWRIDVTEVTTSAAPSTSSAASAGTQHATVGYEIEMELSASRTQELISTDDGAANKLAENLSRQLWFMLQQLNPTHDVLEVEDFLQTVTDAEATRLSIGQCGTIKRFMESKCQSWRSAISPSGGAADATEGGECKPPRNFIGCMPVNFSRHNIEEVQRSDGDDSNGSGSVGYYLSEKTDGVRYLMVFTGKTVVLVDRASHETKKVFQPKMHCENLAGIAGAVKPGAILDGEVVVHRKLRRPIFIVFDVLANSASEPILHLPFEQRLRHLKAASFVKKDAGIDVFNPASVSDPKVALPLVRKNFVKRVDLDQLLSNVHEERGMRIYKFGETHNHLTDGIIFQPNMPYVCGTDVNLLKWKYLDTVTIDVEILPPRQNFGRNSNDDEDVLRVGVMGEEGTSVDMTRYLRLPSSERHRLEADRAENGSKIAEVGFDPTTGEWYYRTMRPDKVAPNHISTVLGTLLELAESLSTEELRYRMSIPSGTRDTYSKDVRNMQKQLLDHQRRKNKAAAGSR